MCMSPRTAGTSATRLSRISISLTNHWSRSAAIVASCFAEDESYPGETMKPTIPIAGASTMHAPATVLRKRWGSVEPNMEDLLSVDPSVQGKTLLRADRYSYLLPNLSVQIHVGAAVGADVDETGAPQVVQGACGRVLQARGG